MPTRRRLTHVLIALVVLGLGRPVGAHAADGSVSSPGVSLEGRLTRDVFRALIGQEFSLLLANRPATTLVLLRLEDAVRPESGQFSAIFQGTPDLVLKDGTFRVTHATAGTTDMYLRPKGRDDRHTYYEATFNVLPENAVTVPAPVRERRRFERPHYEPGR